MNRLVHFVLIYSSVLILVRSWKEIEYDRDGDLSLQGLVEKYGSMEISKFDITLSDGYIIQVFRLKKEGAEKLKPILFLHGFSGCGDSFFIDKRKAIPFLLSNEGYDIWIMNSRGTIHSRNHKSLNSSTDPKYWDFSWQEIGMIDMPATIDLVLENNDNDKVALVGHSEGSYDIFVGLAELPEYNDKVGISFHWGATAHHSGCKLGLVSLTCTYRFAVQKLLDNFGYVRLLPSNEWRKTIVNLCRLDVFNTACRDSFFEMGDVNAEMFDDFKEISFIFTKCLCGGSMKELVHFLQIGQSGRFARFDYGKRINKKIYNSTEPPLYHLERITSPTVILCGEKDIFCWKKDIEKARTEIPNIVFAKVIPKFAHLEFLLEKTFRHFLYDDMMRLLKKYL